MGIPFIIKGFIMYRQYFKWENFKFEITADNDFLLGVERVDRVYDENANYLTEKCCYQLEKYFKGELREFSVPIKTEGTDFQKEVWQELRKIAYGEYATYKDIAVSINRERACRAVGNAVGKNNFLILIPCHRVLAAGNRIGGFSAGLDLKEYLLEHEGIFFGA